jgi:hypothetical protein
VQASLDKDAQLTVAERHAMVFDGDWNGGERRFDIRSGQHLDLISLERYDPATNSTIPLTLASGDIGLDQYSWDGTLLRWRSRRVSDPPFQNQELSYIIRYTMRDIVMRFGNGYVLDHDFAFPDRPGVIRDFNMLLTLDPVWQAAPQFTQRIDRTNLEPGESVRLEIRMTRTAGTPAPQYLGHTPMFSLDSRNLGPAGPIFRGVAFAITLLIALLVSWIFESREASDGVYARPASVDSAWLEKNIFKVRPEVIGAAWDGETGQAEVSALIAVMTAEKKIETTPGASPRLRLLVRREKLSDYERAFVERLFPAGNTIDPETLKKHYAKTGFDPARPLRAPLNVAARKLVGQMDVKSSGICLVVSLFLVLLMPGTTMLGFGGPIASMVLARRYRTKARSRSAARMIPVPILIIA